MTPRRARGRRLVCGGVLAAALAVLLPVGQTTTATAQKAPARIISLVPAVTEMLYAIGAGDRVVGVSSFDRFPPGVQAVPKVGALLDPDLERILALRPDLVVVYHNQKDLIAQLERGRIPTFLYVHGGLQEVTATLRQIGRRVGEGDRAAALASAIEARIAAVRDAGRNAPRRRTLIVMGRDALSLRGIYASGGRGFIHDMVAAAGGENVFGDVDREAVQATTELILARRPEVILELRAEPIDDATRARELAVWGALSSLPAVAERRVHILADPRTVIPGPRVAEAVELIARVLRGGP